ncbi:hypothetical protein K431DRAFT_284931 [Polychaeton citri CBS 116435]|uniref:CENP-V/GFA domain-containing protein n=1 Tax=Polychaeton citri CBS 116435 TaxID=1314669 RepID=A0A9P4UQS0_9PEZI|nr:hypothetical protein K431DRAFT_284931 [Polychaeton citri CBS 116435]
MADINHLYGSCACERNQYAILVPTNNVALPSHRRARVFFDNSLATRRTQAAPLTAWLRVPLDWYQSCTVAHFADETHGSIRKTFEMPSQQEDDSSLTVTRKQFCGYCGTHLTAWRDDPELDGTAGEDSEFMDVTLGSLLGESLRKLEELGVLPSDDEGDDGEEDENEGLTQNADEVMANTTELVRRQQPSIRSSYSDGHMLRYRGVPYFEEMVENSRLGRIKRQKGRHVGRNGNTTVQWEIVEIDGDKNTSLEEPAAETPTPDSKRQRIV